MMDAVSDQRPGVALNGVALNDRVHDLIVELRTARKPSVVDDDDVFYRAGELRDAASNVRKHADALKTAQETVVREREYLTYWEARYREARARVVAAAVETP